MARFDRLNNSSPAEQELQADKISVGRTAFDFSCIHNGNAIIGALTPVDCFDVVPNEDIDLSLSALLEFRNPTTRQLFNGMRVYFHAYYNRLTDLWEGARNWIDNGRRGDISLTRPRLIYKNVITVSNEPTIVINACTPMSLLNYLGLPPEVYNASYDGSNYSMAPALFQFKATQNEFNSPTSGYVYPQPCSDNATLDTLRHDDDYFPADCCMAYQRNWRDFYSNKNLLQNNYMWFPDNEEHFILSYACERACCINYEDEDFLKVATDSGHPEDIGAYCTVNIQGKLGYQKISEFKQTHEANNPATNVTTEDLRDLALYAPNLSGLKFRQFKGDRFTACSPFPDLLRGDVPILNTSMDAITAHFTDAHTNVVETPNLRNATSEATATGMWNNNLGFDANNKQTGFATQGAPLDVIGIEGDVNIPLSSLNITMSDIYTLETLTAFRRRLGLTNGDYNQMIQSQYGVSPNVHDRKGTYIGGFYQDFAFSSVTQQSQSTVDSPLGQKAGQGVSSGSGSIGHFHTPDFGWIQIYMSVVPDVYYTQGKPRMFSKKSNLEMYFPLFNNLPAQAIRNDELFNGDTPADNEAPYAYEDRYAEYKSRHNRVSGLMGLSHTLATYDASRIIARRFDTTPAFNSNFVTMIPENVDMNVFSVVDEPPIDFSVGISCRRVSPMPYTAIEGSLSSPGLNSMGA